MSFQRQSVFFRNEISMMVLFGYGSRLVLFGYEISMMVGFVPLFLYKLSKTVGFVLYKISKTVSLVMRSQ